MVVFGSNSPRSMLVYGVVSIAILAFSYFVIIKPITDDTNNTVNSALQQSNHTINKALNQSNQALQQGSGGGGGSQASSGGSGGSAGSSSSAGGQATAAAVYSACMDAINNSPAGQAGCASARTAFQQCSDQATSLSGTAKTTAINACQDAANQTVSALKTAP